MIKNNNKVVVLAGGWTSESKISRETAKFCVNAACESGWEANIVELTKNVPDELKKLKPNCVLNALHGQIGEDGSIQGLLNVMGIPYTHSGVLASAVAMDKLTSKIIFNSININTPNTLSLENKSLLKPKNYNGNYVLKPKNEGSSFGVKIITKNMVTPKRNEWPKNCLLMAEEYINGKELTVGVLDGKALCVTEIISTPKFYDFEAKYSIGKSKHILPAKIPEKITKLAKNWAEMAFKTLGCRGIARADFKWDEKYQKLYLLEINTQPGMTKTSLLPEQAKFCGISNKLLINYLLENAKCD